MSGARSTRGIAAAPACFGARGRAVEQGPDTGAELWITTLQTGGPGPAPVAARWAPPDR